LHVNGDYFFVFIVNAQLHIKYKEGLANKYV